MPDKPHKCLNCKKEFKSLRGLHIHLKSHGGMQSYYQTYYPRFDLYDNSIINFQSKSQYFSAYFNSDNNRKKFYSEVNLSNKAKESVVNEIKTNADFKEYSFLPSENYLILSKLPTIENIKRLHGSCAEMCKKAKLEPLFTQNLPKEFWERQDFNDLVVLVDTREQKPFDIKGSIESKLDFGDYTSTSHYSKVFVERKSIPDFISSLGSGADRFEKELKRAEEFDSYVVMVVEGSLEDINKFIYTTPKHRRPNLDYSLHNLRKLLIDYAKSFQVLFCNGRAEAEDLTKRILYFGEHVKNCDLQYFLNYVAKG
jgi:hypothetical protein